jgi:ADP-ribose pyrophosphatase
LDDYYVWESPDAVLIVAVRADGLVPVVRQYKHAVGREVLEFPAGAVDDGEAPADAARRELLEETGYVADDWELLCSLDPYPSKATGRVHMYVARGAREAGAPHPNDQEELVIEWWSLDAFAVAVADGRVSVLAMVTALHLARERLGQAVRVSTP